MNDAEKNDQAIRYDEIAKLAGQLSYKDKLRLAQLLNQLAKKEEGQSDPEKKEAIVSADPSNPDVIQYVAERIFKLKPIKKAALLNSIRSMFQFQGGISDDDVERMVVELQKSRHLSIDENNRVSYLKKS